MNAAQKRTTDLQIAFEGLGDEQVLESRERYGENRLPLKSKKGFWRRFAESFGDPIIKILLIALGVNILFLFQHVDWLESAGIALAILLATLVSTISEHGSESAFEKLQEEAARISCKVWRGGVLKEIPVEEVVVGDILSLQAGDRIAADGIMIAGSIEADQSALNGEAKEAPKRAGPSAGMSGDLMDKSCVFSGTVVVAGEGLMRVRLVGGMTFYGRIAEEVQEQTRESPLKVRLGGLAGTISRFGYIAAGLVAFAYFFNIILIDTGFDFARLSLLLSDAEWIFAHLLQAVTLAVTVIVMAVPEGLPMMINVVLSSNMKKMLRDNVLVRKLVGIETAGSLNILFTDKTGTLTAGHLSVAVAVTGSGECLKSALELQNKRPLWDIARDSLLYNSGAVLTDGRAVGGNATDRATLNYIAHYPGGRQNVERVEAIPFDSAAKFMATRVRGDYNLTFVKGAPELLLPFCNAYYDDFGRIAPLFDKSGLEQKLNELAENAMRVILLATAEGRVGAGEFPQMKLVALLGVRDEVRMEALPGVNEVRGAGVQVVMITGDAKPTAIAIARETGIFTDPGDIALTSEELNHLDDAAVTELLPRLKVVARALPSDKSRLVRLAQECGLVAGMTGDGVNDAPALKKSDVGFAMGSGTEVAKQAGDIVILDDNIGSIARAIRYGRTIFKSIRKFIIFQLTMNISAVGVSVIAPLIGVDTPLTVIQMLWINMVMDTLGGIAFGGEPALKKYMFEPPKRRDESIMNRYMWSELLFSGIYTVVVCIAFLKSKSFQMFIVGTTNLDSVMTAFFALFIFFGIFNSFCARTHMTNLFDHISLNKTFAVVMGTIILVQIFMIYFGGAVFRTSGLQFAALVRIALLAFTVIPAELARRMVTRKDMLLGC